jgi:flavorubredoxin
LNYFYFKGGDGSILFSCEVFQKYKLKDKLEVFDSKLSETQNMYNNNYRKIFDSGNKVNVKKYK